MQSAEDVRGAHVTEHTRKARKRRTLSRKERAAIASALRDGSRLGGNDMTSRDMLALASELETAIILIETTK